MNKTINKLDEFTDFQRLDNKAFTGICLIINIMILLNTLILQVFQAIFKNLCTIEVEGQPPRTFINKAFQAYGSEMPYFIDIYKYRIRNANHSFRIFY